jgi:hypothetical protein
MTCYYRKPNIIAVGLSFLSKIIKYRLNNMNDSFVGLLFELPQAWPNMLLSHVAGSSLSREAMSYTSHKNSARFCPAMSQRCRPFSRLLRHVAPPWVAPSSASSACRASPAMLHCSLRASFPAIACLASDRCVTSVLPDALPFTLAQSVKDLFFLIYYLTSQIWEVMFYLQKSHHVYCSLRWYLVPPDSLQPFVHYIFRG